jgi:hypothetical protein
VLITQEKNVPDKSEKKYNNKRQFQNSNPDIVISDQLD